MSLYRSESGVDDVVLIKAAVPEKKVVLSRDTCKIDAEFGDGMRKKSK